MTKREREQARKKCRDCKHLWTSGCGIHEKCPKCGGDKVMWLNLLKGIF